MIRPYPFLVFTEGQALLVIFCNNLLQQRQVYIPSGHPDAFNQFVDIGPAMLVKLEAYLLWLMPEYQGHKPAYLLLSAIQLVQLESPSV